MKIIAVMLVALVPVRSVADGGSDRVAAGLWRLEWPNDRSGYMCVDADSQPWHVIPYDGVLSCVVEDASWTEKKNGNRARIVRSVLEQHDMEGDIYRVKRDCRTEFYNSSQGAQPFSTVLLRVLRSWRGDFRNRLTFTDSAKAYKDGVESVGAVVQSFTTGDHQMSRVGACPASLPPGRRCVLPGAPPGMGLEWPTCSAELRAE
jgi:hypothetical protein